MNNEPVAEYPKNGYEIIEEELRKNNRIKQKYNKPGIYCIKIEGRIVYIGKSLNMLTRISQHIFEITRDKQISNKYKVMRQAKEKGYDIGFGVLKRCYGRNTTELDSALGDAEASLIRQYKPALNYQLPHLGDYWNYDVNEKAKTICLYEIVKGR